MKNKVTRLAIAIGIVFGLGATAFMLAKVLGPVATGYALTASLIAISIIHVYDILGMVKEEDKQKKGSNAMKTPPTWEEAFNDK